MHLPRAAELGPNGRSEVAFQISGSQQDDAAPKFKMPIRQFIAAFCSWTGATYSEAARVPWILSAGKGGGDMKEVAGISR